MISLVHESVQHFGILQRAHEYNGMHIITQKTPDHICTGRLGSGHFIFMGVPEDYPRSKLFFWHSGEANFLSKITILSTIFYKLLVRNKLFFQQNIGSKLFCGQFFCPPPHEYKMAAPLTLRLE